MNANLPIALAARRSIIASVPTSASPGGDQRMRELSRRQLLQRLASCVATAGTVVLAQTVLADSKEAPTATPAGPDERADRLADELLAPPDGVEYVSFLNGAFRNGGGFRNGAFRNGGGFANGGFRNGGFANGGFRNGGFRNGAFRNW